MYHKYSTPALVLAVYRRRESAVVLSLLTRDHGLITASAQGVRRLGSKLRYSLTQFSVSEVVLVRGRGGWSVVNAQSLSQPFFDLRDSSRSQAVVSSISALCQKLMDEGQGYDDVFEVVISGFDLLRSVHDKRQIKAIERIMVMRLLYMMGYLEKKNPWSVFLSNKNWSAELVEQMSPLIKLATLSINRSLTTSDL